MIGNGTPIEKPAVSLKIPVNKLFKGNKLETEKEGGSSSLLLGFNILEALMGFAACGAKNIELAKAVNTSSSNITRVMRVIIEKGWGRKGENGRFYPTSNFGALAVTAMADFDRLQKDLENRRLDMLSIGSKK